MYKIKQIPEDFIVKENLSVNIGNGKFLYFIMTKKNWATQVAIERIASALRVNERRFSYAGQKDKNAVTSQYVAVENLQIDSLKNVKIKDITIKPLGYSDRPIRVGSVDSNHFSITVRNMETELKEVKNFCNYYDDQRFGGIRPSNAKIGKLLVQGKFEEALKNYLCYPSEEETSEHKTFRNEILKKWGDFKNIKIPGYLPNEKKVIAYLAKNPKDFIGAIRVVPKRISTLLVQSFQSLLFNRLLSKHVKENFDKCYKIKTNVGEFYCTDEFLDKKFPLPGYDCTDEEAIKLLKEENVSIEDFKVNKIQYLSSRTTFRDASIKLNDFNLGNIEDDEINKGKEKRAVSFSLPSGSYATIVIKCMTR